MKYTNVSVQQLGAVISQNGKPIVFYSRKLTSAQGKYTTTERELLAIVETLKEYRNVLISQNLTVYTNHKNLTYKIFNIDRVIRWRLIIKEYGPNLTYIEGPKNIVADTLFRWESLDSPMFRDKTHQDTFYKYQISYTLEELPKEVMPLNVGLIETY